MSFQKAGNYGTLLINFEDQDAQTNCIEELGLALSRAGKLFEAIAFDRMNEDEVSAAVYFAAMAIKKVVETDAERCIHYSMDQSRAAKHNGERPTFDDIPKGEQL